MRVVTIAILVLLCVHSKAQFFSSNYMARPFDAPRLSVQRASVYIPGPTDYHYAHHPSIAYFKGRFICIFSNGIEGEDEPGQRVAIATSTDFLNWTTTTALRDLGITYELTPGGLLVANSNLLVAYYTQHDSTADFSHPGSRLHAISTTDGLTWSAPVDLGISIFPCHRPSILSSGRLLLTGNRNFYYSDDPTGLSGWTLATNAPFLPGQSASLVEGAILEHNDSIYTLFRDAGKRWLWQESSKNGSAWSSPVRSAFTNDDTKAHFGKLPNGKYYYVGTPDTLAFGNRTPLVLSVSDDGFSFNKHYIIANDFYQVQYSSGRAKGGQFGYPYSIIKDDSLYVVVSRRKEKIEVLRFALSQLDSSVGMPQKDLSLSPQLDGTQLPLNAGWVEGLISSPASGTLTADSAIHINCTSGQSYTFQVTPSSSSVFNPSGDYTIEFRLRVTKNNGRGIDLYTRDGVSAHTLLCIDTNRVFLNGGSAFYNLDATEYHTYRLAVKRSEKQMYLFIDGAFIRTINRSENLGASQLLFGKSNAAAVTEAYLDYLAYDLSGAYQPVSTAFSAGFGSVMADISQNRMTVRWESLQEQNCAYYDIELSGDGRHFTKVGKVNSTAVNGLSDTRRYYEFTLPAGNIPALSLSLLGFSLVAGALFKRRKSLLAFCTLLVWGLVPFSCKRNHVLHIAGPVKLYLRITQVNKDGGSKTSEPVIVVNK